MSDPRTFWLTITNIVLGIAVILAIVGVVTGVLCSKVAEWKKRRSVDSELDSDMHELFHTPKSPK